MYFMHIPRTHRAYPLCRFRSINLQPHAGRCMRPAISGAHRSPIRTIDTKYCVDISLGHGIRAKNQFERRMRPVTFHLTVEPCIVAYDMGLYFRRRSFRPLPSMATKSDPPKPPKLFVGEVPLIIESRLARHKLGQ